MENLVIRRLDGLADNQELLNEAIQEARKCSEELLPKLRGQLQSQIHAWQQAKKAVETALDAQVTLTSNSQIERNSQIIDERIEHEKELVAAIQDTEEEIKREQELDFDSRELITMLRHATLLLEALEPQEKVALVSAIIERVNLYPDELELNIYGSKLYVCKLNGFLDLSSGGKRGRPSKKDTVRNKFVRCPVWLPRLDSNQRPID